MLGPLINGIGSMIGCLIGMTFKRFINEKQIDSIFIMVALVVGVIGIQGAIKAPDMIVVLVSLCIGSIIGVLMDIDGRLIRLGELLKRKLKSKNPNFVMGFVSLVMLQCIGAMAILGPLAIGLKGDYSIILLKSTLDFVSAIIFASIYGSGTLYTGFVLIIYEGIIFLFSSWISPFLSTLVIEQVTGVGSVMIIGLSLTMLNLKEIKVANYLPSLAIPIIYYGILSFFK